MSLCLVPVFSLAGETVRVEGCVMKQAMSRINVGRTSVEDLHKIC